MVACNHVMNKEKETASPIKNICITLRSLFFCTEELEEEEEKGKMVVCKHVMNKEQETASPIKNICITLHSLFFCTEELEKK